MKTSIFRATCILILIPFGTIINANGISIKGSQAAITGQTNSASITIKELGKQDELDIVRVNKHEIIIRQENKSRHTPSKKNPKKLGKRVVHSKPHHRTAKPHHRISKPHHHRYSHHQRHINQPLKTPSFIGSWYVSGELGMGYLTSRPKMTIETANDNYQATKVLPATNLSIETGYYFDKIKTWPYALSVGLQYTTQQPRKISGYISQSGVKSYGYSYQTAQEKILLTTRFDLMQSGPFATYAQLGIGLAKNSSRNYQEFEINNNPARSSLAFNDKSSFHTSYLVGFGVSYRFAQRWIASLGYTYTHSGRTILGDSQLFPELTGPSNDLSNNNIKLGLLYQL